MDGEEAIDLIGVEGFGGCVLRVGPGAEREADYDGGGSADEISAG
jgi:hypothetical protein